MPTAEPQSARRTWTGWLSLVIISCFLGATTLFPTEAQDRGRKHGPRGDRGGREGPKDPLMALLDIDRDGTLSPEEIEAAPTRLRLLDGDDSGSLTRRELADYHPPRGSRLEFDPFAFIERVFKNDLNADGLVSRNELPPGMKRLLKTSDLDKDDALSRAELESTLKRFRKRHRLP